MSYKRVFRADNGAVGTVYRERGTECPAWTFKIEWAEGLGDESPWFGGYYDSVVDAEHDCRYHLSMLGKILPQHPIRAKGEQNE